MTHDHLFSRKHTKIVATLGPASSDRATFARMVQAGLNAVRLNFSHGDHAGHAQIIDMVRDVAAELDMPLPIIGDLRGPHIRVGDMDGGGVQLTDGQPYCLTPEACLGNTEQASVSYPQLARDLHPNDLLLLDDGAIQLKVNRLRRDGRIEGTVVRGGSLSSRRGINVPGVRLSLPPLTQKDLQDIDFAIAQQLDFLALSFVQSANDIKTLKTILAAKNSPIAVIAKIEMSGGVDDIEAIVQAADAVMVARGDLALEMSFKDVPIAQKRIIATCRRQAVPVITATQMLESMLKASHPTRAEVTDVANAIFDGTDAVMLSGETAIGQYPVEVVATMSRIAHRAETAWRTGEVPTVPEIPPTADVDEIISFSSAMAARRLGAACIVSYTRSGQTARNISRFRPLSPVLALTPVPETYRQLALGWGVTPLLTKTQTDTQSMQREAVSIAVERGLAHPGDHVVITAGNPAGPPGNTNLLSIETVED